MSSEPSWMTCADVAERWQVSTREVQRMAARGEITHMRVGRQIRINATVVSEFEKAATQRRRTQRV
jgi:excisionase family DNA binding protein